MQHKKFIQFGWLVLVLMLQTWVSAQAATDKLLRVNPQGHYKVVYDIHTDDTAAMGVNKGLYYVRGLLEAFAKQGVKTSQLDIHVVMHGEAAKFLLNDDRFQQVINDPFAVNINNHIVDELLKRSVHIEICHSTMKAEGWQADDLLPGVEMAHDGYTRIIQLQNEGYALISDF